jgi:hypothetical protein
MIQELRHVTAEAMAAGIAGRDLGAVIHRDASTIGAGLVRALRRLNDRSRTRSNAPHSTLGPRVPRSNGRSLSTPFASEHHAAVFSNAMCGPIGRTMVTPIDLDS